VAITTTQPETYVSIDIETDGPAPGIYSMLSLGAVAFDGATDHEIGRWYEKLRPLPGASVDMDTQRWWEQQHPDAYAEVRRDPQLAPAAMLRFARWVSDLPERPVAVAWPAAFDFGFVNWYLHKFAGRNPFGFAALDIRSYLDGLAAWPGYYGLPRDVTKKIAGVIDKTGLRPHVAVDDALEQGRLFMALRRHALQVRQRELDAELDRLRAESGGA
jgi:hypothetical protein